ALDRLDAQPVDGDRPPGGARHGRLYSSSWHFDSAFVILCETHFILSNRQMAAMSTNRAPATRGTAPEPPRYRNQAAQRVLAVLSCFAGPERDLGVTELALRLGMNKNMVHRALTTLTAQGFVTRAADRTRYQLGYRVLALAGDDDAFDI